MIAVARQSCIISVIVVAFGLGAVSSVEAQDERYLLPNNVVQKRLDSLTEVALRSADDNRRIKAISSIAAVGIYDYLAHRANPNSVPSVRYQGVVRRLERIYWQVSGSGTKEFILRHVPLQAERQEGTRFLAQVARSRNGVGESVNNPLQVTAIYALEEMGQAGRNELQRLWASSNVEHPIARRALAKLKEDGWRTKPER